MEAVQDLGWHLPFLRRRPQPCDPGDAMILIPASQWHCGSFALYTASKAIDSGQKGMKNPVMGGW